MKLTTLLPMAALVLAAAPAAVFAQDTTKTTKDSVSVKTTTTKASNGEVSPALDPQVVLAAIGAPGAVAEQIKKATVGSAMHVQVVDVTPLSAGATATDYNSALEKGHADLAKLQAAIAANVAVAAALKASAPTVTAADIVAATVAPDGAITLYFRPTGTSK